MSQNLPQHHSLANPAGYTIAANYQINSNNKLSLVPLIEKALADRDFMDQLCDRVYQIMLTDLQHQQDRSINYRGW